MLSSLVAASIGAAALQAGERLPFEWPSNIKGKTIVFAGAHPDDEWGMAPLLASACLDGGAKCHFAVASGGRDYGCFPTIGLKDPEECSRRRREEMKRSAALFGGTVEMLGWEPFFYSFNQKGMDRMMADWATAAGGRESLVQRWLKVLKEQKPTMIFTFDPRHGSTCDPAHRAVASLVVEAVNRLPVRQRPHLWLEQSDNIATRSETVHDANRQAGFVTWPDTANETRWFDGNQKLANGKLAYDYVLLVRKAHTTQYPGEASGKQKPYAPIHLRQVPVSRYNGQAFVDYCTSLNISLPTFDIPGNKEKFGLE